MGNKCSPCDYNKKDLFAHSRAKKKYKSSKDTRVRYHQLVLPDHEDKQTSSENSVPQAETAEIIKNQRDHRNSIR